MRLHPHAYVRAVANNVAVNLHRLRHVRLNGDATAPEAGHAGARPPTTCKQRPEDADPGRWTTRQKQDSIEYSVIRFRGRHERYAHGQAAEIADNHAVRALCAPLFTIH